MPYIRTDIFSGDVYEGIQTFSTRIGNKEKRSKKLGKSSEKQKGINERNAKRKVARLINANFKKGDIFLTLTYAGEVPDEEKAKKDLVNFLRRVKYYRKKQGMPEVKYIAVTESEDKRIHHHVIMTAMSMDIMCGLWESGKAIISRLSPDQDYTGIAKYITKESHKEFARRWTQSRNLVKPTVKTKVLKSGRNLLKAPKGYKIIEQRMDYTDWTGQYQYI
ncbi:MAG: hypothetical protein N2513_10535, partial [Deltaproteobacteria bacterium]|nr:hypothetical protein [Deltaproteobacteria bacterium]